MSETSKRLSTQEYLRLIGVPELPPLTSPFDPGYDPVTLESHLDQSSHLMASLKISMACWQVANESATRHKIAAARSHNVPAVTGGGPFEVAVAQGQLEAYLDLCADLGITRIECGEGFTELTLKPQMIAKMAHERGLAIQYGPDGGVYVSDWCDTGECHNYQVADTTIVLVEHDVPLVFELCSTVVVMELGRVVAVGPPEVVRADPKALAAYLGASDEALMASGPIAGDGGTDRNEGG